MGESFDYYSVIKISSKEDFLCYYCIDHLEYKQGVKISALSGFVTNMTESRQSQKTNYIVTAHRELYGEILAP